MRLLKYQGQGNLIVGNVFVGVNPWESDLIRITPKYWWSEYEIKISRSDFKADLKKSKKLWRNLEQIEIFKHDVYRLNDPYEYHPREHREHQRLLPTPKQFYFVTPKGLVDVSEVPEHAGLIEIEDRGGYRCKQNGER